uniref:Uncharacterized protein n=1 Tax=Corethron hystrix TaxID=216773 RepID=A0A7S1B5J2_9STRA
MTELLKMMEEEPQSMAEGEGGASRDAPTLWNRRRYRTPIVSGIEGSAEVAIEKDPSDEGGVTSGGDWWKGTPLHPQGEASAPVVLNRMTNNDGAVEGALNSSKRRMHREFATIEEGGRKGKEEDSSFDRRRTNGGSGDIQESGAMRVRAGSDLAKDGSESGNDSDDPILGSAKGATKFPNDIAEVRLSKLVRSSPVVTSESPSDGTKRKDKNIIDDDKWDDWKRRLESLKIKASTPVGGAQPKTDRVPAPPSTGSKNGSKNFPSPASEGCRSNSERSTGKKVIRDSERNIKAVSQQSPVELERLIDGISPILNSSPSCFNGHQNNVGDREEVKNLKLLLETREQQVNKCRQQLKEVTEKFNLSTQHLQKISEQNAALSTEIEEKRNNEKDRIYTIKVLENKISSLRSALTNANNKLSTIKTEKEEAQAVQTEELQRAVVETNAARNEAQCLQDRLDKIMDANERHRQTIHNLNTKQEQRTKKEDLQESKLRRIAKQNVVLKENLRRLEGMHQKEKETKKDIISKLRGELDSLKESSGRENQYFLSQLQTAQTHVDNERRMRRALQDEIKVLEEENRRALDRCLWDSEEREFSSNHLSQKLKASGIRKTNDNDSSRITRTISNSTSTKLDDSCSLDERLANLAKTISSFDDTSVDNR